MADPYQFFSSEQIATASRCPLAAVQDAWPRLVAQMALCGENDRMTQIAMIGTAAIETAGTFRSIHEYGTPADWAGYEGGSNFAGRGYVQLTHLSNYRAYGQKVAALWGAGSDPMFDLVAHPDNALDPDIAAAVAALYFRDHGGDGLRLIPQAAAVANWHEVRRLVYGGDDSQGTARVAQIATALGAAPAPVPMAYNLDYPIRPQDHDWDCFEESANWALHAAGRNPSDAWLEAQMLADGIESTANGLEDGSGAQAAAWITRQYSDGSPKVQAHNAALVSFDDVKSVAGASPVLLGGHHWGAAGHWSGIRRYDPVSDLLTLANPANGYANVFQTMNRQQFAAVGPCSLVIVTADGAAPPPPPVPIPPVDPKDAQIADLTRQLIEARNALGVASVNYAQDLENVVVALRKLKPS